MKYFDVSENGNFILRGQLHVSDRRECPIFLFCSRNPTLISVLLQQTDGQVNSTNGHSVAAAIPMKRL